LVLKFADFCNGIEKIFVKYVQSNSNK